MQYETYTISELIDDGFGILLVDSGRVLAGCPVGKLGLFKKN
eukprot:COSAG02_NODE_11008_length_1819_cov_0.920653_2_plen_42_part_00